MNARVTCVTTFACKRAQIQLYWAQLEYFLEVLPGAQQSVGIQMCVTRRKLQTRGNAEEHKKQEAPTINPIGPTDRPHRPSTKHYRKDSLGDA